MRGIHRFWLTVLAVGVIVALVLALIASRPAPAAPADHLARADAGVGDRYFPSAGGSGYDVQNYDVQLREQQRSLAGQATVTARATRDLDVFHLDLYLPVQSVTVDGDPATFTQQVDDLAVTARRDDPERPAIRTGETFTVTVTYAGQPGTVRRSPPSYYVNANEFVIAGEPVGASLWFPANDHPSDPATMTFTISVPRGTEAIAAGRLVGHGPDPGDPSRDSWQWRIDAPSVTYATFLAVGQYQLEQGRADGRGFTYVVSEGLPAATQRAAFKWLHNTPRSIAKLEKYLGPYPFSAMGGFVPSINFYWGGLETAMAPVYNPHLVGSESLLNHEFAHMWFGDSVTLAAWDDLFDNESLASYAEWLTTAGSDPARDFRDVYDGMRDDSSFWAPPLADPGAERLFERVYDRGPTAVHALRIRMGDRDFFAMLRAWAGQRGPFSLEQFRQFADQRTPENLTGFFAAWLDGTRRPDPTRDNGVPH